MTDTISIRLPEAATRPNTRASSAKAAALPCSSHRKLAVRKHALAACGQTASDPGRSKVGCSALFSLYFMRSYYVHQTSS